MIFCITGQNGRLGHWLAPDEDAAREVFAADAGYASYDALLEAVPDAKASDIIVEPVASVTVDVAAHLLSMSPALVRVALDRGDLRLTADSVETLHLDA